MMKKFGTHYIPLIMSLILILAATAACQNKEAENITQKKTPVATQGPSDIAELVSSMSMYYFKEPVKPL